MASGLISPSIPITLKQRNQPSSFFGVSRSGFYKFDKIAKKVFLCSTVEGVANKHVSVSSSSESRVARRPSQGCKLIGCGSALPEHYIYNDDVGILDLNTGRIRKATDMHHRLLLSEKDGLKSLAVDAARKALQMAQVKPHDVDLILMCTSIGGGDFKVTAPQIQKALGCKNNPLAYSITAACSGFVLGLVSAACYIRGGGLQNVLVIGADSLSPCVDPRTDQDPGFFGDAAGAVLMQACDGKEDGLFAFDVQSDGDGQRNLKASCIQMYSPKVFHYATKVVSESIEFSLQMAGLSNSDIDWLLLHQANQRIIDGVVKHLNIPDDGVISNLANYGNTSAASIPLDLDEAVRSGKVQSGHKIAAAGFGAGRTWASAVLRWG